jgi:hypothetical protein
MKVTPAMVTAAKRAEYDFFNRGRRVKDDRFIPTPDAIIRAMLEAALSTLNPPAKTTSKPAAPVEIRTKRKVSIVTAHPPKPRR